MRLRRAIALLTLASLLPGLLSGCSRGLKSETVVIPDSAADLAASTGREPFEVKTIYRLQGSEPDRWLGWTDGRTLLGASATSERAETLTEFSAPYDSGRKALGLGPGESALALSPDGSAVAALALANGSVSLALVRLSDGKKTVIEPFPSSRLASRQVLWSDNGRFLSYLAQDGQISAASLSVYDTSQGLLHHYGMPDGQRMDNVKLSEDGEDALAASSDRSGGKVLLLAREGDAYTIRYEHSIRDADSFDWLNPNQFLFTDVDDSLYVYDKRNGSLSLLLGGISRFQLSPDKKTIAFIRNEDAVFAGQLQGNNVLNEKTVYQGVIPSGLIWSPDHASLLVTGWKPYGRESQPMPVPSELAAPSTGPMQTALVSSNILEFAGN
jgi:WD40 repeat protein